MGRIFALVNQKGGVGKTTAVLGLASAAAHAGRRVLVVDLDPQAASTWALGREPSEGGPTAADLVGSRKQDAVVQPSAWGDDIDLLPSSQAAQGREGAESGSPRTLRKALRRAAKGYDAVLIDCPPSLGNLTTSALAAADHALIVVEPTALGLRGIGGVADLIDEVWDRWNDELDLAGVILNKVPGVSAEAERRTEELARIVGKRAIWKPPIPQRVLLTQAVGERRPIHSYGARAAEVSVAFDALWARVHRLAQR